MMRVQSTQAADARAESPRRPPSPPPFHKFRRFVTEPHLVFHEMLGEHGDFIRWRGLYDIYVVNHPDFIRPVLSRGHEHFSKRIIDYRVMSRVMGDGLVTSDGPLWARQRRLMQPVFSHRNVAGFDETINGLTSSLMSRWDARTGGEIVWIDREMAGLTFRIAGSTLFSADIERHAGEVAEILEIINLRPQELRALMTLHSWIPTPHNLKWKRALKRLDRIVHDMIAARRRTGPGGGDILGRLLAARDEETGEGIDDRQIRDEVVTLLMAGHDTSAHALTWTLYLLATHPEVESRLAGHLAAQLNGAPATAADLPRLPYLKQVVQESMRLYPPVWAIARRAEREVVFGDYLLPANAYVAVVAWTLHRHPEFWPDPDRFEPDRFEPDRAGARHSYCYLPFGAGPRTCIGAGMAMLETQLVLAQIVQRFRVHPVPDHPIETHAKVTLKPRYGMPVTMSRR